MNWESSQHQLPPRNRPVLVVDETDRGRPYVARLVYEDGMFRLRTAAGDWINVTGPTLPTRTLEFYWCPIELPKPSLAEQIKETLLPTLDH